MEHPVNLTFSDEDRKELVRSICNVGSSFYININTYIPVVLKTLPGPFVYPGFDKHNPLLYFYRIGNFYPENLSLKNRLVSSYFSLFPCKFISDVTKWFKSALFTELENLPGFVESNPEVYSFCERHFPLPYPKPSRFDAFSMCRDNLYLVLNAEEEEEEEEDKREDNKEGGEEDTGEATTEENIFKSSIEGKTADGKNVVKVSKETREHLNSMFKAINEGKV